MRLSAVGLAIALIFPASARSAEILTAEGLGPVRIGMSLAQVQKALGAKLKLQGADSLRECAIATHPNRKAWMMFHEYRLVRIDVEEPGIAAPEGGGVGMTEAVLRKLYGKRAKFRMHPYGDEPNDHYVTVVLPAKDRLLIFETWGRRVQSFRIGTRDAAPLVEGCN